MIGLNSPTSKLDIKPINKFNLMLIGFIKWYFDKFNITVQFMYKNPSITPSEKLIVITNGKVGI